MISIYNQGDIILISFPFSDLSNTKKRPALVISKDNTTKDLILLKITSVLNNDAFSYKIKPASLDFKIQSESEIRLNFISTIEKKLVVKKIGSINKSELSLILDKVKDNISLADVKL